MKAGALFIAVSVQSCLLTLGHAQTDSPGVWDPLVGMETRGTHGFSTMIFDLTTGPDGHVYAVINPEYPVKSYVARWDETEGWLPWAHPLGFPSDLIIDGSGRAIIAYSFPIALLYLDPAGSELIWRGEYRWILTAMVRGREGEVFVGVDNDDSVNTPCIVKILPSGEMGEMAHDTPYCRPDSYVNKIFVDHHGHIFAYGHFTLGYEGDWAQAAKWDGDHWIALDRTDSLRAPPIHADPAGYLYKMYGLQIYRWDGFHWRPITRVPVTRIDESSTPRIAVTNEGKIFFASNSGQVFGGQSTYYRWDSGWLRLGYTTLADTSYRSYTWELVAEGNNLWVTGIFDYAVAPFSHDELVPSISVARWVDCPPVLEPPLLRHPPDRAIQVQVGDSLAWHRNVCARSYRIQISEEESFASEPLLDSVMTGTSLSIVTADLVEGERFWRVQSIGRVEVSAWSTVWPLNAGVETNTESGPLTRPQVTLNGCYPNPVRRSSAGMTIDYTVGDASEVRIDVFDIFGRQLDLISSGFKPRGRYSVIWNPRNAAAGTYYVRLTAGLSTTTIPIVLLN